MQHDHRPPAPFILTNRCIYFLDPDQIVPPSVPGPHVPPIPRTRTNSFSQPDHEPVILEPPVTTNPLLARPTLPPADIAAIRRLSGRVNVLPVIARADTLSNDRLAAVKLAIRRDLAEAGIGFGIFDTDPPLAHAQEEMAAAAASRPDSSNGYAGAHGPNGASASTPPTSPTAPPLLRLPYALISPDMYSHSDGVSRRLPSRHELVQQYTPSTLYSMPTVFPRAKFVRAYRWGNLDVLDPAHSDFVALRTAIFHHMEVRAPLTSPHAQALIIIADCLPYSDRLYSAIHRCTYSKSSGLIITTAGRPPSTASRIISRTCNPWDTLLDLFSRLTPRRRTSPIAILSRRSPTVMCIRANSAVRLPNEPCRSRRRPAARAE